jgi:hypothetical protein
MTSAGTPRRLALRWVLPALLGALGVWILLAGMPPWEVPDMAAYRGAADRLVAGQPLYPASQATTNASDVYRYAPWFALMWVPFRDVPDGIMAVAWSAILVLASVAAVWPLLRRFTSLRVAIAFLGFVICLRAAAFGNIEPLMVAALVHGVERRGGPLWIAAAASLKGGPLALVLVYAGRREWARVAWTIGLTVLLTAPLLLFDLSQYPTETGASLSLLSLGGPIVWVVAIACLSALTVAAARTRWAWLAGAATALVAMPRLGFYALPILLVGSNGWADEGPAQTKIPATSAPPQPHPAGRASH